MNSSSVFLVLTAVLFAGASPIVKNWQGGVQVISSCTMPNAAALTFDDGPSQYIRDVINELEKVGGKGTFFLNGQNYVNIYEPVPSENVRFAVQKGHQVASHTWSHPHLNSLSRDQVVAEFQRIDDALYDIARIRPAFMRPPFGEYNDVVKSVAQERRQNIVLWDFDSNDSLGATPQESNQRYDNLVRRGPKNVMALNHDPKEPTAHIVAPHAIKVLSGAGYRLVTVAECLGLPAYHSDIQNEGHLDDNEPSSGFYYQGDLSVSNL